MRLATSSWGLADAWERYREAWKYDREDMVFYHAMAFAVLVIPPFIVWVSKMTEGG